jgi:hypothetical protein
MIQNTVRVCIKTENRPLTSSLATGIINIRNVKLRHVTSSTY